MNEVRYQNLPITVPAASIVDQLIETKVQLDQAFKRITGIAVTVLDDGGAGDQLLVGARTQRKVWVDPVPVNVWNADTGVSPDHKFLSVDIQYAANDVFFIQVTPVAALATDALIYMVLRLEVDYTELPRQ
jgi:hypothetical protein